MKFLKTYFFEFCYRLTLKLVIIIKHQKTDKDNNDKIFRQKLFKVFLLYCVFLKVNFFLFIKIDWIYKKQVFMFYWQRWKLKYYYLIYNKP